MSTNTETTVVDAIRADLTTAWHTEATPRRDGYILSPGQNGVVAVTVGSVGRTNSGRFGRQSDVLAGFMSDSERVDVLASIADDLAVAGWNITSVGEVVIVDGRNES